MEPARSIIIPLPSVHTNAVIAELPHVKKVNWKKLAVHTVDEIRFITFDDIVYCSAQVNYTRIFTRNGKSLLCSKTLKEIESKLPGEDFLRIHHSYLVNINEITAIKKQEGKLEICNEIILPYSRNMKKYLSDFLCS
jgi:two-component system, LytTR family, response regulator